MGGLGSGGGPGVGRKPKTREQRWLDGGADKRGAKPRSTPAPMVVDEFDAPNDLAVDERQVWLRLAPHAFAARTLTKATEYQFVMLCRNVVLERQLAADVEQRGGSNHRGIIQRIDAELARFSLAPFGKPMTQTEGDAEQQPVSPLAKLKAQAGALRAVK